jgi:hypothetical protein
MNLRYIQYNILVDYNVTYLNKKTKGEIFNKKNLIPDYRLKREKNLYLSLFEKTYSEVSVLIIIFILRLNLELHYELFRDPYYSAIFNFNENYKNCENLKTFDTNLALIYNKKEDILRLYLAKMSKENPNLLDTAYFLHTLT